MAGKGAAVGGVLGCLFWADWGRSSGILGGREAEAEKGTGYSQNWEGFAPEGQWAQAVRVI